MAACNSNGNGWTAERRARQAELIRSWRPWERSTGPRTVEGKVKASANRQKALDAARQAVQDVLRALVHAQDELERIEGRRPF